MSDLKPGTLCVIVAGCPENIGIVVEVLEHIGPLPPSADAYYIQTVSGRNFPQLKTGPNNVPSRGSSSEATTDRHKLRPLIGVNDTDAVNNADLKALSVCRDSVLDTESAEPNARRCHVE